MPKKLTTSTPPSRPVPPSKPTLRQVPPTVTRSGPPKK